MPKIPERVKKIIFKLREDLEFEESLRSEAEPYRSEEEWKICSLIQDLERMYDEET